MCVKQKLMKPSFFFFVHELQLRCCASGTHIVPTENNPLITRLEAQGVARDPRIYIYIYKPPTYIMKKKKDPIQKQSSLYIDVGSIWFCCLYIVGTYEYSSFYYLLFHGIYVELISQLE